MIRVAIVEDDNNYHQKYQELLKKYAEQNNVEFNIVDFYNGIDFLETFKGCYDLIIMDIELPGLNGIKTCESLRKIDPYVPIIVISYSSQYAVDGYLFNAIGYIVKPITEYDFFFTLNRSMKNIEENNNFSINITTKQMVRNIRISDIYFIEVSSHMLKIKTITEEIVIRDKIKKYEDLLKNHKFNRCDNSYLVNLRYCNDVDLKNNIIRINGETITISRSRKKMFLDDLVNYLGEK